MICVGLEMVGGELMKTLSPVMLLRCGLWGTCYGFVSLCYQGPEGLQ